jgi:predicted short-subunit dehydrogenase-like oxidoreductase (DUF2520 family)
MKEINKIVFIGAGNVATHLARAFHNSGKHVVQVFSRTEKSAKELAQKINCSYTVSIPDIYPDADLYVFSVADHALSEYVEKFPHKNVFIVHTSGSLGMNVLNGKNCRTGVFYPLQTFSKEVALDLLDVPVCIEAENTNDLQLLKYLAERITSEVHVVSSSQREQLHLAAVFACNFANYMFAVADDILHRSNLSFDILKPLIRETCSKIKDNKPAQVQTGPAMRNDSLIVTKHIDKLSQLPDYQKMYTFISESIIKSKNKLNDQLF